MVGEGGALPLPWLEAPLARALGMRQAHALLLHGPEGVGQFELALTIAQSWLCDAAPDQSRPACGRCASCRLVQAHSHPDLLVLLPEALREPLGWDVDVDAEGRSSERASKAKPSKEIKVDAVRALVAFAQTTAARGRGKAVVLHPAERMNPISANTLLKTLEEPPGGTRFVLSCAAPHALLPTVRSRCQAIALAVPEPAQGLAWLQAQGAPSAEAVLAGAGGQPLQALEWLREGLDDAAWRGLPDALREGRTEPFAAWPLPRLIDVMQRLCHDALSVAAGAAPRYFPPASFTARPDPRALQAWAGELRRASRHAEHPWQPALMLDALVHQARIALSAAAPAQAPR